MRQQHQSEQARPSSRGDNHASRGDKELYSKDKEPLRDKEPLAKKTSKENKGPPGNAWLKGRPRILEKQDEAPVSY